jgi:hypothetical protein
MSTAPDDEDRTSVIAAITQHVKQMLNRLLDRLGGDKTDQGSVAEPVLDRKGEEHVA